MSFTEKYCRNGHIITAENSYIDKNGYRNCKICKSVNRKKNRGTKDKSDKEYKTHVLRTYGVSPEEYNEAFKQQEGCCKICGTHELEHKKRLYVDHCHETGEFRGLLCQSCNSMLGYAKDNIETLKKGIEYLNKNK